MISASSPRSRQYSPIVQPEYAATYCIAADSEAPAATTIVCAIAPFSSSLRTTLAIALAAADRDHRIDRLVTGLYRLRHRLAPDHARRDFLDRCGELGVDRALGVDR